MNRVLLALLIFLVSACDISKQSGLKIESVNNWSKGERGHFADIRINYDLSDTVLAALDNGVPLVFILKLRIEEIGVSWFDQQDAQEIIFRLRYRPLSTLYEVEVFGYEKTIARQRFVTREALFSYLGELQEIAIAAAGQLKQKRSYVIAASIHLDIGSLPLPMRPKAYLSPSWRQQSGWSQWSLDH